MVRRIVGDLRLLDEVVARRQDLLVDVEPCCVDIDIAPCESC